MTKCRASSHISGLTNKKAGWAIRYKSSDFSKNILLVYQDQPWSKKNPRAGLERELIIKKNIWKWANKKAIREREIASWSYLFGAYIYAYFYTGFSANSYAVNFPTIYIIFHEICIYFLVIFQVYVSQKTFCEM